MSKRSISAGVLLATLCCFSTTGVHAAMPAPARDQIVPSLSKAPEDVIFVRAPGRHHANRNVNVHHHHHVHGRPGPARGVVVVRPVRPFVVRPYYGAVVAGVTLGAMIAATAVAVAPTAPSPSLCWYWADQSMIQGYWDYCKPH
jgi:hypothetical protein